MKKLSITTILCFIILLIISCGGTDTKTDDRLTTAKSVAEGETIAKSIPEVETTAKSLPVGEVAIGTQTWTTKNLDAEIYRNGDAIPQVQDASVWANLTTGAWCYYENKTVNGSTYGKQYNWYAVTDPRGLAPKGYHIPTDEEWTILTDYLGGEKLAGAKMKSTSGWENNGNGSNTSGFAGLPGGFRLSSGSFVSIGSIGLLWSSSESDNSNARNIGLSANGALAYDDSEFFRNHGSKQDGYSVRCLRDGPRHYKCNSCQWTGTKLNNLSQCPHCTSDNISSSFTTHFYK